MQAAILLTACICFCIRVQKPSVCGLARICQLNRSKRLSSQNKVQIQVEQPRDLARDSGQRKLTYSLQNHCASSRSVYLSRRLDSHLDELAVTHHLKEVGVFSTEINLHFTKGLYRRFFPDCSPFIISFTVLFLLLVYFFC